MIEDNPDVDGKTLPDHPTEGDVAKHALFALAAVVFGNGTASDIGMTAFEPDLECGLSTGIGTRVIPYAGYEIRPAFV